MTRKKRPANSKNIPEAAGVKFELEENAEQLFLDSLEHFEQSSTWREKLRKDDSADNEAERVQASLPKPRIREVDLHGMNLTKAQVAIDQFLQHALANTAGRFSVRIITGKGRHSGPDGAVLPRDIHAYVRTNFAEAIERIDASPADVALNGLPIRGHFDVVLRGKAKR